MPARFVCADVGQRYRCRDGQGHAGKNLRALFTTKDEGRGTGLGLSTVYGIVNHCGGAIRTYSEPGVGTTMRILLPAMTEKAPADTADIVSDVQRGTETVLLVEDDETVLALCSTVLQTLGYTVLEAEGAKSAIEISRSYRERFISCSATSSCRAPMGPRCPWRFAMPGPTSAPCLCPATPKKP